MKAKRVRGNLFYCGCGATFVLPKFFEDDRDVKEATCQNCQAQYQFEEISHYTVTPLAPSKT